LKAIIQHENFFSNMLESFKHIGDGSLLTFSVFALFFLALFLFAKFAPKLPGAIILAPIGILLGYLNSNGIIYFPFETLGDKFGNISFKFFEILNWEFPSKIFEVALVVALIVILETMLSAKIADVMTHTKHNERKEMLGLGLANIFSGLMGGMPATAALARTSLNIKTGATNSMSGVISVLSTVLISVLLLEYFKYIPMFVISAILMFVAFQMVEMEHYSKLWKYERSGFFISLIVAVITVVKDPMFGILSGVAISLLFFINKLSHGHFNLKVNRL